MNKTKKRKLFQLFIKIFFLLGVGILFPGNINCQQAMSRCVIGYSRSTFQEIDPLDVAAAIEVYVDKFKNNIEQKKNRKIDFSSKIFSSFEEIEKSIRENSVAIISLSVTEYYELKKRDQVYPYLSIKITNDIFDQYCMVTYLDSGVHSVRDLKNKILAIPKPQNHVLLEEWLNVVLDESNMEAPRETFSKIKIVEKESNSVYDVFFKKADCAIIRRSVFNTLCELNPQLLHYLKIIKLSPSIVLVFTVANKNSDMRLLDDYLEEALATSTSSSISNILKIFKAKSFGVITEDDLKNSKEIIDKYKNIMKRDSKKKQPKKK